MTDSGFSPAGYNNPSNPLLSSLSKIFSERNSYRKTSELLNQKHANDMELAGHQHQLGLEKWHEQVKGVGDLISQHSTGPIAHGDRPVSGVSFTPEGGFNYTLGAPHVSVPEHTYSSPEQVEQIKKRSRAAGKGQATKAMSGYSSPEEVAQIKKRSMAAGKAQATKAARKQQP
jgi:hypothetical protein